MRVKYAIECRSFKSIKEEDATADGNSQQIRGRGIRWCQEAFEIVCPTIP